MCVSAATALQDLETRNNYTTALMMIQIGMSSLSQSFWQRKSSTTQPATCCVECWFNYSTFLFRGWARIFLYQARFFWMAMFATSGPLVLLHGFHPGLLQICSMHVLNLGLMFDLNGSALTLSDYIFGKFCYTCFGFQFVWLCLKKSILK